MRRVVVTGGSVVSSLGIEDEDVLACLKACHNKVVSIPDWQKYKGLRTTLAAPVTAQLRDFSRKELRGMGRVAILALNATETALEKAGLLGSDELKAGRAGIAYGSSAGNVDGLLDFYGLLLNYSSKSVSPTTYIKAMPQTCAANLSVRYGLTGRLITTNTACTSGSMSIGYAYEAIRNGVQDIMIAGGAEELTPADAAVFDSILSASTLNETPEVTPRAYDRNRDGLVVGEGAGTLILEEYEHAIARGARIYAEIAGFATNTDGVHITHPNGVTIARVMRMSLESAGIEAKDIAYINMHGTATVSGDIVETNAVHDVFGPDVPVSTLKNYTGHTLGACGAIEAWSTILMMRDGWFCPNINLKDVDPECAQLDYITGTGRTIDAQYVMSNNFAFGGINTSLIFKRC